MYMCFFLIGPHHPEFCWYWFMCYWALSPNETTALCVSCRCWISAHTQLLYIIHGPIQAALVVSILKWNKQNHPFILLSAQPPRICPGELFISPEHRPSSHHQTEGDPLCRVNDLHEGGQGYPDSHPPSGCAVHPPAYATRGPHQPGYLRFLCEYRRPLPGKVVNLWRVTETLFWSHGCNSLLWTIWWCPQTITLPAMPLLS